MSSISPFLITDQPGFTPQIGHLVSMMNYVRVTTLEMARGLSIEELDFSINGGNSIGMLLEHIAATEFYYQVFTFEQREPSDSELEAWLPAMDLGELGQAKLKGKPLRHYLRTLKTVRDQTYTEFAKRDDAWLEQEFPLWGQISNNYFCWFHVFEDEINHRGQIRLIYNQLPQNKNRGRLGIQRAPASLEGMGLKIVTVIPNGPASNAGLQPGDTVVELNGVNLEQLPHDEIDFRAQAGQVMHLRIRRKGTNELLDIPVMPVKP